MTDPKSRYLLIGLSLILFLGFGAEVRATILEPAIRIDEPGLVLFVDGLDKGPRVRTFNVDATFPLDRLDFGFVYESGFTGIALRPAGAPSLFAWHTFTGGQLVDFALRDRLSGDIFAISDPRNFTTQYYFSEVDPSFSRHPVVTDPYFNALILEWDLSSVGLGGHGPLWLTMTQAQNPVDGMQPAPVPLPGAISLFGSGVAAVLLSRPKVFRLIVMRLRSPHRCHPRR
jgi:hypothetical protein